MTPRKRTFRLAGPPNESASSKASAAASSEIEHPIPEHLLGGYVEALARRFNVNGPRP